MINPVEAGSELIDVRNVIARVEELRTEIEDVHADEDLNDVLDMKAELKTLESLLNDLAGYGGDEQWEGSWYPVTLIHEDYFVEAMQELVQDIGDLPRNMPGYLAIDWEKTADNLRADYSSVDFEGEEYWYR